MRGFRGGVSLSSRVRGSRTAHGRNVLHVESLETRDLLSVSPLPQATPEAVPLAVSSTTPVGLTPAQVKTAYGFTGVSGDGTGQTIAVIDAYNDPNIVSDLAVFSSKFGLAPANIQVVNQSGGSALPASNSAWLLETSMDVEWAHAIAPGAKILLVEANSSGLGDLLAGVNYARAVPGVSVVSMSWGSSEFPTETAFDSDFTTPAGHTPVTFVAASGDAGSPGLWPALSSNVLAVGGTSLTTTAPASTAAKRPGVPAAAAQASTRTNQSIREACKAPASALRPTCRTTPTPTPASPSIAARQGRPAGPRSAVPVAARRNGPV